MSKIRAFLCAASVAALALLVPNAASAHTNLAIGGGQIVGGGWVAFANAAPPVRVADGPASDGTLVFTNADAVAHTLRICAGSNACTGGIQVTIPAASQKSWCQNGLTKGTYTISSSAGLRGEFRITVNTVSCGH